MKEAVEQFLKGAGVSAETITALKADELPEDFKVNEAVSTFIKKRQELTLNDGDIMKELKDKFNKEQYPAIVKPILKRLKDMTGLTTEEMDGLKEEGDQYANPKKVLEFAIDKLKKSGANSADEIKEQMFALRKEYDEAKENHTKAITDLKNGFEAERTREKVSKRFSGIVSGQEYVVDKDVAHEIIFNRLNSRYDFVITDNGLQPMTKDGNKAADEKGFLTAAELVKREAEAIKILKKSNGGEGGDGGNGGGSGDGDKKKYTSYKDGELSPEAQKLKDRIENS
jgi:hypothetical protein